MFRLPGQGRQQGPARTSLGKARQAAYYPGKINRTENGRCVKVNTRSNGSQLEAEIIALADGAVDNIASFPKDYAQHRELLYDLKTDIVKVCAQQYAAQDALDEELGWRLAHDMPDFSTAALYARRYSLLSMAGIVFFGFLAGGLLSTLLGWIGMGGEIIRVATVLGALYGAEYLSANARARTRLLAFLGLGSLAAFAAGLVAGVLRLTSWADLKRAVFGESSGPGPLKRLYLLLGAAFIFVFLSKKATALDIPAFKASLREQAGERARWLTAFFEAWGRLRMELSALEGSGASDPASAICPKSDCPLALSLIDMLDHLDADARRFLAGQLALVGYAPGGEVPGGDALGGEGHIVWDDAVHADLYDTVGMVRNGDTCRILRRYASTGGAIIKGYVQKETD